MRCCSLRACALTKLANHHRVSEEGNMGRILASLLAAASLLSMALVGGIGLGLPRRRSRLGGLGAQLLHHRCPAVGAASMAALQPPARLHDSVVSSRWL